MRPVKHDYASDWHGWLQGTLNVYAERGRVMKSSCLGFRIMVMPFLGSFAEVYWGGFPSKAIE